MIANDNTPSPGKPVILPLLKKLYLKKHDSSIISENENVGNPEDTSCSQNQAIRIMKQKVEALIQNAGNSNPEQSAVLR
jgi:hypothetical protein